MSRIHRQMVIDECCPFRPMFAGKAMRTCGVDWNETDLLESPEDVSYLSPFSFLRYKQ